MTRLSSIHIKILCGYYFFFAFILAIVSIIYLTASDWMTEVIPENDYFSQMSTSDFSLWGVILLVVAVLEGWLALALFQRAKMAWVIAIIFSVIGLIWSIYGLTEYTGLFNAFFLIVHSYFLWILFYRYNRTSFV